MKAQQFETLPPSGPVTLWLRGGEQLTGTGFVFDKTVGLVALTMADGGTAYIDIDAVDAFVNPAVPPP